MDLDADLFARVLIETLWNVKFPVKQHNHPVHQSFNRNIVECKVRHRRAGYGKRKVLIETLWNVKEN